MAFDVRALILIIKKNSGSKPIQSVSLRAAKSKILDGLKGADRQPLFLKNRAKHIGAGDKFVTSA